MNKRHDDTREWVTYGILILILLLIWAFDNAYGQEYRTVLISDTTDIKLAPEPIGYTVSKMHEGYWDSVLTADSTKRANKLTLGRVCKGSVSVIKQIIVISINIISSPWKLIKGVW